jgi:Flp pilus assembly protein TadD
VVQVGVQAMADRYTYIPMIGIAIMMAWAPSSSLMRSNGARAVAAAAGLVMVVSMVVVTRARLPVWQNNVALFTAATMRTMGVDEYTAHMSLGATLLQQKRFEEARAHYQQANGLRPKSPEATYGVALTYLHAGRVAEAIGPLEEAVGLAPEDPDRRNDLAVSYVRTNRIDDAIREFRRLTAMRPNEPRYAQALASLLARRQT